MDKKLKYLRERYLCTVNPGKRKVWSFRKGRQIKRRKGWHNTDPGWPTMGFVCPICRTACSNLHHYLIGRVSMCENCALEAI